jgi:hypothetical protein
LLHLALITPKAREAQGLFCRGCCAVRSSVR